MPATMRDQSMTTPDNLDVIGRPKMARADIHPTTSLSPVVKDAAKRAFGKQEAAAAHLKKDKGNFSRDVDAKRLTLLDLEELGAQFLAAMGEGLVKEYGPLRDPADHAEQLCDHMQAIVNEFRQFVRASRSA